MLVKAGPEQALTWRTGHIIHPEPGSIVVCLTGEFDVATAGVLGSLLGVLPGAAARLVLDVAGVSFIDCAGLVPLLPLGDKAGERRVGVQLRGHSPAQGRLFAAMDRAGLARPRC